MNYQPSKGKYLQTYLDTFQLVDVLLDRCIDLNHEQQGLATRPTTLILVGQVPFQEAFFEISSRPPDADDDDDDDGQLARSHFPATWHSD